MHTHTVVNDHVIEADIPSYTFAHTKRVYIKPIAHYYNDEGEEYYIKWGCPICNTVTTRTRVNYGDNNCFACGVNFAWEGLENA